MKKIFAALLLFSAFATSHAQDWNYEKDRDVKNLKATVEILNDGEMVVLNPDGNPSGRYISLQLPKEYKVAGLHVNINGYTGKIPPYVRMMGTPLRITKIWLSKAEKKKYKLSKCKYTFEGQTTS